MMKYHPIKINFLLTAKKTEIFLRRPLSIYFIALHFNHRSQLHENFVPNYAPGVGIHRNKSTFVDLISFMEILTHLPIL